MSDLKDEEAWLRAWIIRLRTLLRFAIHPEGKPVSRIS